ncbi:Mcm1p [Saccharomyces cerevisiae x Saccharomyces kudriavzevii VIN7]|uniref:Mcm1p n=1 Tax=Saccharomyces cerevisiae x Saccharomyces kudriavzevii (strain VIN7) TaxID=1095631 RepID=H0GZ89_SACCK|nr:Mcm1p [Saccharomyces cerevisiae x Saccharomyces kudriavzevii VIN7]
MSDIEEGTPTNNGQQKERRKIEIKFIENKTRRHVTFSKRKHGIMKKAFELSVLTGTQVLLLVVSETGLVYTFSTPKFEPIVTQQEGRNLIQACLNAPDDEEEDDDEDDDEEEEDDANDMQRQQPQHQPQQQQQQQQQVLNAHANSLGHLSQDQVPAGALKQEVKSQLLGSNPSQNPIIQQQQHHAQNPQTQQPPQQQQQQQHQMPQHPRPQQGIPHPQQPQPPQQQQQQQQPQQQQQQQPLTGIHQPHQQAFGNAGSPYLNAEQNAAYQQYFQEPQQGQY